jgi:hypothetical protein
LLAQTAAPTPLPQTAAPRSTVPAATEWASGITKSGIIVALVQTVGAGVDNLVPRRAQAGEQILFLS